jgi:hypothetical protein
MHEILVMDYYANITNQIIQCIEYNANNTIQRMHAKDKLHKIPYIKQYIALNAMHRF